MMVDEVRATSNERANSVNRIFLIFKFYRSI